MSIRNLPDKSPDILQIIVYFKFVTESVAFEYSYELIVYPGDMKKVLKTVYQVPSQLLLSNHKQTSRPNFKA